MPRSVDPVNMRLLSAGFGSGTSQAETKNSRVSVSVDDIRGIVNSWHASAAASASSRAASERNAETIHGTTPAASVQDTKKSIPWPLPQFYLKPPSATEGGSAMSLRIPSPTPTAAEEPDFRHRGELNMAEKYNYDLSKAQLKASSRTSALLAGFAMVCLVELQYDRATPKHLLIILGVVTSLLVSVHLLALMMSTCILPYMEATGCTQDSPHKELKFYIDLSWLFSTCIGLLLFLFEIGVIFYVKFDAIGFPIAGYMTTIILIPVVVVFILFSYMIHKSRVSHSLNRFKDKVDTMSRLLEDGTRQKPTFGIQNV